MIDLNTRRPRPARPDDPKADAGVEPDVRLDVWLLLATIALTGIGMMLVVLSVATLAPVALG